MISIQRINPSIFLSTAEDSFQKHFTVESRLYAFKDLILLPLLDPLHHNFFHHIFLKLTAIREVLSTVQPIPVNLYSLLPIEQPLSLQFHTFSASFCGGSCTANLYDQSKCILPSSYKNFLAFWVWPHALLLWIWPETPNTYDSPR